MPQRIALITGGSRGIGAAIALRLAEDGYDIAFSYASNEKAATEISRQIEAKGRKALAIKSDPNDESTIVTKTIETFGHVDALICNAGTTTDGTIDKVTTAQIDTILNLNLRAVMVQTMEAAKHMREGGRILYIGSAFGSRSPFPGIALYSATKSALQGFARGVARDLAHKHITANVIEPGPIDTDLNPASGESAALIRSFTATESYGTVTDIASAVSFLASPSSAYITGATLPVDGGLTA